MRRASTVRAGKADGLGARASGRGEFEGDAATPSPYAMHAHFPFMPPALLWRMMSAAGFLVYLACTLRPPNAETGGSQLNAALTLFQSLVLWKAPQSFGHSARRALSSSCFVGYAASAGVTLSDTITLLYPSSLSTSLSLPDFGSLNIKAWLSLGSFLMFFFAGQANMVYTLLDTEEGTKRSANEGRPALHPNFDLGHWSGRGAVTALGAAVLVAKAFARTLLVTTLSLGLSLTGKLVH